MHAALARGAAKVYAPRDPAPVERRRIVPLTLDVTDAGSIAAAVAAAGDVTVLINNAGGLPTTASMLDITEEDLRKVMEINFFAPVLVARRSPPSSPPPRTPR